MFEARMAELEALARAQGLEFFPTVFDVVPQDIMTEIASYGLPTRARHWSYGKVYQSQRLYGTMGLSKIYEIVLNVTIMAYRPLSCRTSPTTCSAWNTWSVPPPFSTAHMPIRR